MNTTVINIFGGPGSGKSTTAAGLFYSFKLSNKANNCELVREYVKKWAWDGIIPNHLDQLYLTGKQSKAEHMLYGKVNYIITDCPLWMGAFYEDYYHQGTMVEDAIKQFFSISKYVPRINFLLKRNKPFEENGRFQKEAQAREIDEKLDLFIRKNRIRMNYIDEAPQFVVSTIVQKLWTYGVRLAV